MRGRGPARVKALWALHERRQLLVVPSDRGPGWVELWSPQVFAEWEVVEDVPGATGEPFTVTHYERTGPACRAAVWVEGGCRVLCTPRFHNQDPVDQDTGLEDTGSPQAAGYLGARYLGAVPAPWSNLGLYFGAGAPGQDVDQTFAPGEARECFPVGYARQVQLDVSANLELVLAHGPTLAFVRTLAAASQYWTVPAWGYVRLRNNTGAAQFARAHWTTPAR